jgi:ubiquinone/menaquinone biosynthesis C-methylase UbiE
MSPNGKDRWQRAQKLEKEFWEIRRTLKSSNHPEYNDYIRFLKEYIKFNHNTKIFEIGCGCETLVERMNGKLYGLDPLMNYFFSAYKMKKNVKWTQGIGESMPYKDNFFDLIIIVNALDHAKNPSKVLNEVQRCLKRGGHFFLVQNCYDSKFARFKKFMEKIGLGDTCHPYSFTIKQMGGIITSSGLKIIRERIGFDFGSSEQEPTSKKIKRLLKEKGIGYIIKHSIIRIMNYLPEKMFKKYLLYIFLARK